MIKLNCARNKATTLRESKEMETVFTPVYVKEDISVEIMSDKSFLQRKSTGNMRGAFQEINPRQTIMLII
eukprot:1257223-Heterocapsa_arctica.AAC.1